MFLVVVCCFLLFLGGDAASDVKGAYVTWNAQPPRIDLHDGMNTNGVVAWARFTNEINVTGFSYLEVFTNAFYPDNLQAYSAGVLEGYLTKDLIGKHLKNQFSGYCVNETDYCNDLYKFLTDNLNYVNDQAQKYRFSDPYWHQVDLALMQLKGIDNAYNNHLDYVPEHSYTNVTSLLFLNIDGDLEDLESALKRFNNRKVLGSGSCSGLVKILPNNEDIYFAQDTWSTYSSMLRILKKYSLQYHRTFTSDEIIPGHTISFSSSPARIFSGDDFYIVSSGLAAMETTIGNSNASLWKYVTSNTNLEWLRNIAANRLATSGREWSEIFSRLNSGTYNNQWLILDYKKFSPGQPLQNDLLWVLEQIPGYVQSADLTDVLRKQGYFPSYNSPYFKDIFNLSGLPEMVKKYGDWFSYDKTPRALIFARDQGNVVDMETMTKLMRQNDYTNDPLSVCDCNPPHNAENAIAARSDLNPVNGTYPFPSLQHRSHGATDMKLTNYTLSKSFQFRAVGGPTYDPLPPFQWSTSGFNDLHEGQPDLWAFKPFIHKWSS